MSAVTVIDRFLKYISFPTASSEESSSSPSTDSQLALAEHLLGELRAIGASNALTDGKGYVYAELPASEGCEQLPVIGLIAHIDTSPAVSGSNVRARILSGYDGGDAALDSEGKYVLSPKQFPQLLDYIGQDLIVTDGSTLLGADDKAGVAEIMAAADRLLHTPSLRHGKVVIAFTPDEEVGRGTEGFDIEGFGADFAYTVDGGALGELDYENFNACDARIEIRGVSIHPGDAKNRMRNAALLAAEFVSMLPEAETPEHTEGYEGFYHLTGITAQPELASLHYIIRDHDRTLFEARKAFMQRLTDYLCDKYGEGVFKLTLSDSYYNMREIIEQHMEVVERARSAFIAVGVEPVVTPIRGGTDGAMLSWRGLPCPNLSTGGHNFHGRFEYIPVQSMEKMTDMLIKLVCE